MTYIAFIDLFDAGPHRDREKCGDLRGIEVRIDRDHETIWLTQN